MKKIVFATATLAGVIGAFDAQAQTAYTPCTGAATASPGVVAVGPATPTTGQFIVNQFTPKCSANVVLVGIDRGDSFAAGAVSLKGKSAFAGSTTGGGVTAISACGTSCVAGSAASAASAAPSS